MPIIDAHQHYWQLGKMFREREQHWFMGGVTYAWREAGLDALNHDFMPADLEPQLALIGCERTVLVQVLNNLDETRWYLSLAQQRASIAGVVGWVDLTQPTETLTSTLNDLRRTDQLCGIRHLVEFEPDDDWLLRFDALNGLRVLATLGISYDLLLRPHHLSRVPALSEKLPELPMVIDHLAKPDIKQHISEPWRTNLQRAATNPRLYCKLSGMITEADVNAWKPAHLAPYVEATLQAFGVERVMYGSDWPVCTLAGTHAQTHHALREALQQVLGGLDAQIEQAIFHDNAARFYRLHDTTTN
jgi:L-fuconolactonase